MGERFTLHTSWDWGGVISRSGMDPPGGVGAKGLWFVA